MSTQTQEIVLITGDSPHASHKWLSGKCLIAAQSLEEWRCPNVVQLSEKFHAARALQLGDHKNTPFTAERTAKLVSVVLVGAKFLQCGEAYHHKLYALPEVRINAVAPSLTSTEATVDLENGASVMAAFRDRLPHGRSATPDEVAGVIALLASEDALFINGVNLAVDGGLHASNGQPNFLLLFGQGTEEPSVVSRGAKPATPA